MQIEVWKTLLKRVPSDQIDNLMMMTAQGTEINVQTLLLMEEDYMVLRGRLAGTNEGGRIFVLPYAHLDHMGFQRALTDAQLEAVFGVAPIAATPPPEAPAAEPVAEQSPPSPSPPAPVAPSPTAPPAAAEPGLLARVPTRSGIIRRLRMRTGAGDSADSSPKQ
jgi:hypothetical protein